MDEWTDGQNNVQMASCACSEQTIQYTCPQTLCRDMRIDMRDCAHACMFVSRADHPAYQVAVRHRSCRRVSRSWLCSARRQRCLRRCWRMPRLAASTPVLHTAHIQARLHDVDRYWKQRAEMYEEQRLQERVSELEAEKRELKDALNRVRNPFLYSRWRTVCSAVGDVKQQVLPWTEDYCRAVLGS